MSRNPVRLLTGEQEQLRDQRQHDLAALLHTFVYGDVDWDDEQRENYLADADEILEQFPHLLPLPARDDLPFQNDPPLEPWELELLNGNPDQ